MDHRDHVALIRGAVDAGGTWADVGSGTGAFTLALADLLAPSGTIWSVDRDADALARQARTLDARFPAVAVEHLVADFTKALDLPSLDGILMANSLHFIRDKLSLLERLVTHLHHGGRFVVVEYDAERGNAWVPFPLSFEAWRSLAGRAGLRDTRRLATRPSRFLGSIYSAMSVRGGVSEVVAVE